MAQSPISAIPPEILSIIFQYVHSEYLITHDLPDSRPQVQSQRPDESDDDSAVDSGASSASSKSTNVVVNIEKSLEVAKSPTFFPYAVASVCPFWENVLSSTPEFWTTLVFFLDTDLMETEKVKKYLSWSRDLPIDIFMTRRSGLRGSPWVAELAEMPRVRDNMQSLMPHFYRCRTLHVDVAISISLPILPSHIRSETPLLQSISFMCDMGITVWDMDDRNHTFLVEPIADDSEGGSAFEFRPKLNALSVDGRNFQRALAENKPWILEQDDLEDLTIFQYVPLAMSPKTCASETNFDIHKCDECRIELYQALRTIESFSSLVNLKFETVHFDISPPPDHDVMFDFPLLLNLTFVDMAPEIIQEILRVCTFDDMEELGSLTFIHCPRLHQVLMPPIGTPTLCLLGLENNVDLEPIIQAWYGDVLSITCCSSFPDSILRLLGTVSIPDEDEDVFETTFPCKEMIALDLHFVQSPPFSVDALRKMIEARSCDVDYSDEDWRDNVVWGPAIMRLRVSGEVPELSREDEEWFRSRMLKFSWGDSDK